MGFNLSNFFEPFVDVAKDTAAFFTGGATGEQAVSGGNIGTGINLDLAGLGIGIGLGEMGPGPANLPMDADLGFPGLSATASSPTAPGGPTGWNDILRQLKGVGAAASPWLHMASGGMGIYRALQADRLAKMASDPSRNVYDPFAGQRAQYQGQLSALRADPSQVTSLPGYKAGLDAVERKMASQGYLGSGNMMLALKDYGGNIYDQEIGRLTQLAGGMTNPVGINTGANLIAGNRNATDMWSRALASLAYGFKGMPVGSGPGMQLPDLSSIASRFKGMFGGDRSPAPMVGDFPDASSFDISMIG